jgi:transcriptional regulator with XRE-family HTH domain
MLASVSGTKSGDSIAARLKPLIPPRSQDRIEKQAKLSKGYLSRVLAGKFKHPDEQYVRAICVAIGADFEWVFYGRGGPPEPPRAASSPRWTTFAATRPAFEAEAALAIAAGVADDGVLDAAAVLLGTQPPTRATAREAILEARRGVDAYREAVVPGFVRSQAVTWPEGSRRASK